MRRAPIGFDRDTFRQIGAEADQRGISFSERVRELVEIGIETEKQEGAPCSNSSPRSELSNSHLRRRR